MTSQAIYNNRLVRLARFLRTDPVFDFSDFLSNIQARFKPDLSCGTSACALGWAAALPEFRALGVELSVDRNQTLFQLDGKNCSFHTVSARLFGLTEKEARYLFMPAYRIAGYPSSPPGNATARQVANHILRFVRLRRAG